MIGNNRKTVSSVRGMTRYGVKLCQRLDKVDKLRDQGYMDFGILGVYERCQNEKRRVDAPTKGDMGCLREKKVIKGDDKKLSK
jgi:hypothetical protein